MCNLKPVPQARMVCCCRAMVQFGHLSQQASLLQNVSNYISNGNSKLPLLVHVQDQAGSIVTSGQMHMPHVHSTPSFLDDWLSSLVVLVVLQTTS